MEISDKLFKYASGLLALALLVLAVYAYIGSRRTNARLVELQNEIAKRDATVEVQQNVFAKLAFEQEKMRSLIDTSTQEGKRLTEEIRKSKQQLLTLTNVVAKLETTVADGLGSITVNPDGSMRVDFEHDFKWIKIAGWTLTGKPPKYELKYSQGSQPLKLTLALTQKKDGSWNTLMTSSEKSIDFDIGVSAVNPLVIEPRWYENIRFRLNFGAGKHGVLGGGAATFGFGRFDAGPAVWGTTLGEVFYGGTLSWAPFKGR